MSDSQGAGVVTVKKSHHSPTGRPRPVAAPERKLTVSRVIVGAVALFLLSIFAYAVVTASAMQWPVVWKYLFSSVVLNGVKVTIELTVIAQAIAIVLGLAVALMLMSSNPVLDLLGRGYLWIFRGVPALVQLLFWFNMAIIFPRLQLGIPFGGSEWLGTSTNTVMTPFFAAILGLALHEAAYMAEVVRSSIMSVDRGQREASMALGMTNQQTFVRVVLPQAMRVMVPNTGNRTIGMLKFTSLASFLAVQELLYTVQSVYNRTLETIPLLMVATIWYLLCVSVLTWGQHRLENHYNRDITAIWRADTDSEGLNPLVPNNPGGS